MHGDQWSWAVTGAHQGGGLDCTLPPSHRVAASVTYGCILRHIRLQVLATDVERNALLSEEAELLREQALQPCAMEAATL